jgi:hypothetical protein
MSFQAQFHVSVFTQPRPKAADSGRKFGTVWRR